jgi:hypothetical protein
MAATGARVIVAVVLDLPAVRALSLIVIDRILGIGVGVKREYERRYWPLSAADSSN